VGEVFAHDPPLEEWADRLEALLVPGGVIGRIAVVAQTDSTQEAAARLVGIVAGNGVGNGAGNGAGDVEGGGLMVIAGRQVAGRGRLGRAWADTAGHGLAVTFALDGERFDDGFLALAAGLAAQRTAEDALMKTARDDRPVGLRWPNDVVERGAGGRKLAGVLVERRGRKGNGGGNGGLALVGIGMNVSQERADWPEALQGEAVSLRQLGSTFTRLMVAERLLFRLERSFASTPDRLARAWRKRSTLSGHVCTFEHNGRRYTGRVMSIEPTSEIVLEGVGGAGIAGFDGEVRLPALSTSLVKAEA
jgi:BirA family transcriptional regulator, biotin operon repressor / biotin---[acetyl-CoA-carboxylase] ligase